MCGWRAAHILATTGSASLHDISITLSFSISVLAAWRALPMAQAL